MSQQVGYDELLPAIYDAAADPSLWPAVLSLIAEHVGARGALVFEVASENSGGFLKAPYFSDTYDPSLVKSYLRAHNELEMADQAVFARHSKATDRIELIPDTVLAISEDELLTRANQKTMMEYGIRFRCGALLNKDQMFQDRFPCNLAKRLKTTCQNDWMPPRAFCPTLQRRSVLAVLSRRYDSDIM